MDKTKIELIVRMPDELSPAERSAFMAMVTKGGEVAGPGLETNVAKAKALLLLRIGEEFVGCAAVKHPQTTYREKIAEKSGIDLGQDRFPFELGYFFISEATRGRGQSHWLVEAALASTDGAGVFATARADNVPMQRALAKAEFKTVATFPGRKDREISLFVRPADRS